MGGAVEEAGVDGPGLHLRDVTPARQLVAEPLTEAVDAELLDGHVLEEADPADARVVDHGVQDAATFRYRRLSGRGRDVGGEDDEAPVTTILRAASLTGRFFPFFRNENRPGHLGSYRKWYHVYTPS